MLSKKLIGIGVVVYACCTGVLAGDGLGGMQDVTIGGMREETVGGMRDEKIGGMHEEKVGGMQAATLPENTAPKVTSANQRGLESWQIKLGCAIVGENVECPGRMAEYRHTFEIPLFGQEWEVYVPGGAYTTEDRVANTRTLHTYLGANLPDNTVKIMENGSYVWKVRGKVIQGRWVKQDEHALLLQKAYRGVDWRASIEKFGADEAGRLLLRREDQQLAGRLRK
ncbi:MAG TPA: hypothetical protein VK149_02320 [Sideroxyarcus sp.]|nr:hypothetical protein [Sideroxyarcus sp.]